MYKPYNVKKCCVNNKKIYFRFLYGCERKKDKTMNITPVNNQKNYNPSFERIHLEGDVKSWLKRDIKVNFSEVERLGGDIEMIGERIFIRSGGDPVFRISRQDNGATLDVPLNRFNNPMQKIVDAVTQLIKPSKK